MRAFALHRIKGVVLCVVALLGLPAGVASSEATADAGGSPAAPTVFVALGHTYSFIPGYWYLYRELAIRINRESPRYVFLLGDLTVRGGRRDFELLERHFLSRLEAPWYWAPGNHDLGNRGRASERQRHVERVGYAYQTVHDVNANFVLINSYDEIETIRNELESRFEKIEALGTNRPTLLLAHHKLWRDPPQSPRLRRSSRHYPSTAILPLLRGRVVAILAGDTNRAFRDREIAGVRSIAVGMGDGDGHALHFARGSVDAIGRLVVEPVIVDVPAEDPWWRRSP